MVTLVLRAGMARRLSALAASAGRSPAQFISSILEGAIGHGSGAPQAAGHGLTEGVRASPKSAVRKTAAPKKRHSPRRTPCRR